MPLADRQVWMSEGAKVPATGARTAVSNSDSDLCWRNLIKINLEARQQVTIISIVFNVRPFTKELISPFPQLGCGGYYHILLSW